MNFLIDYKNFLNESLMDDAYETRNLLLFSDTIKKDFDEAGDKFDIFYDFYKDPTKFTGLYLIDRDKISKIKNLNDYRFTLLMSSNYLDTEDDQRYLSGESVVHIIDNINDYLFYVPVIGERNQNKSPDRGDINDEIKSQDGKTWYFVIRKNRHCNLIKIKSRQEGGKWAEHQLADTYGWDLQSKKIHLDIRKNNELIQHNRLLKNIFQSTEGDVFELESDEERLKKWDIITTDGKKIEIKKYNELEIWNDKPIPIMLAEQYKVANRSTIRNIVKWYNEIYNDPNAKKLLRYDDRALSDIFSNRNVLIEYDNIVKSIKDHYNTRIEGLLDLFQNIDKNKWMVGVFGIDFVSHRTNRRLDFLIKIKDGNKLNIKYEWGIVNEWLGFNRLKLFMEIDGDAWEYIKIGVSDFVRAFKLKDWRDYIDQKMAGELTTADGEIYVFDDIRKYWIKRDDVVGKRVYMKHRLPKMKRKSFVERMPERPRNYSKYKSKIDIRSKIRSF